MSAWMAAMSIVEDVWGSSRTQVSRARARNLAQVRRGFCRGVTLLLLASFGQAVWTKLPAQSSAPLDTAGAGSDVTDSFSATAPPISYRPPAHPDVKLRVDSASMMIGSRNRLVVTGPVGLSSVDFGALSALPAIVPLGEATDSTIGPLRQWSLPFSVYDSVGLSVPGLPVVVDGEPFRSNDVAFIVTFPPLDTAIVRYRSIYREEARLSDYAVWIALGIGLLIVLTLAYFYYRSRSPFAT